MPPKGCGRGSGCSSQPARPLFMGCRVPHPPFMGFGPPHPSFMGFEPPHRPPFMAHGMTHFPHGRGGRGGFPFRGGLQGAGRCRPPFGRGGLGPWFKWKSCQRPFQQPHMGDRAFWGTWWGAPHQWHCGSRRWRRSFGRDALTAATFELARALLTSSREDSDSSSSEEEEEEESPCRSGPENETETRATAEEKPSSGAHQEGDKHCEPAEELANCCRSEDVWEDCGQGTWMTEIEVWPYAENEVEAFMLEDGRVEVRCEHAHGKTPIASNTHVLPCPPCGPSTLTTAHGPPNAQPGVLVLLVTAKASEEKEKAPTEGEAAPKEREELPAEDVDIVDISDAMEKC